MIDNQYDEECVTLIGSIPKVDPEFLRRDLEDSYECEDSDFSSYDVISDKYDIYNHKTFVDVKVPVCLLDDEPTPRNLLIQLPMRKQVSQMIRHFSSPMSTGISRTSLNLGESKCPIKIIDVSNGTEKESDVQSDYEIQMHLDKQSIAIPKMKQSGAKSENAYDISSGSNLLTTHTVQNKVTTKSKVLQINDVTLEKDEENSEVSEKVSIKLVWAHLWNRNIIFL